MERLQILLSTYNGEKYLAAQLDSILKQTYQNIEILVRDDGSTDGTVALLEQYEQEYENLVYYRGENMGVIQSFFDLLRHSDEEAAYYAFADQDDYWMPEKLEAAVKMLEQQAADIPLLYCSDTYVSDENLTIIKKDDKNPRPSFGNALVQNICTGCTAVMNRQLRDIVKETRPEQIVMHDWWFYLSAEVNGLVCYDNNSYIKYRQHGNNAFGEKKSRLEVWKYRLGQLTARRGYIYPQLEELKKWYPDMTEEKRQMVERVLGARRGLGKKIKLICDKKIYRNSREDDLVYRGIVMLGKL